MRRDPQIHNDLSYHLRVIKKSTEFLIENLLNPVTDLIEICYIIFSFWIDDKQQ